MPTSSRFHRGAPSQFLAGLILATVVVCPSEAAEEKQEAPKNAAAQPAAKQSLAIIVDCSNSMTAQTRMPAGNTVSRMDMVKEAVRDLVSKFAVGNDDVAVYFFGHRAGWQADPSQPPEVLLQKRFFNPPRENLKPYEDVELILTLGPLTPERNVKFEKALESVRPWGETPLYLSIHEAMAQFPANAARPRIVVLTDGTDNVRQPAANKLVTKESLLKEVKAKPVPIYIVGFQLSPQEREAAARDFNEIGAASGGAYFAASSAAELTDYLARQLKP